jgi:hypothetical protein
VKERESFKDAMKKTNEEETERGYNTGANREKRVKRTRITNKCQMTSSGQTCLKISSGLGSLEVICNFGESVFTDL